MDWRHFASAFDALTGPTGSRIVVTPVGHPEGSHPYSGTLVDRVYADDRLEALIIHTTDRHGAHRRVIRWDAVESLVVVSTPSGKATP